ncbi:hypothetical protein PUN28_018874 [Cardiocondyla obscurior]|uniref:Uncharacterized protein n=1 Tax=Cardiocondyla obscurior TaxID=286306 RepID=A0AAW2ECE7_9HYME
MTEITRNAEPRNQEIRSDDLNEAKRGLPAIFIPFAPPTREERNRAVREITRAVSSFSPGDFPIFRASGREDGFRGRCVRSRGTSFDNSQRAPRDYVRDTPSCAGTGISPRKCG